MKKIPQHTRILIGMLVGVTAGIIIRQLVTDADTIKQITSYVKPLGDIFMRMIFMMVIPLIISALALGVAELGDVSRLGKIGFRMVKYTLIVTSISVILGVGMVKIFQPGNGITVEQRTKLLEQYKETTSGIKGNVDAVKGKSFMEIISQIVPKNPLEDMVRAFDPTYTGGGLLSVMFFALLIGIAMTSVDQARIQTFKSFLEGLYDIVMKIINYGMMLAPIGVGALLFNLTLTLGVSILGVILKYVLVVLFALALHQFGTYSIILKFFAGRSPIKFFSDIKEVMITAFSTSSSNASLPIAIKTSIEKLKLPKDISHFVLTIGSTANQNGTALYEGITILFLAQCFGVDLSIGNQIVVVLMCILAGMGTAGVPGGSLPVIMLSLISIGVPGEAIGMIYGVDRILDMSRTVLNVTGDITAAAYIAHTEENNSKT